MLIINESDGEDDSDEVYERRPRSLIRTTHDQKEVIELRTRVRELEETLQRTRAEQQAQARAKLSEQETRIVSMREEFNEQLGVARRDARLSALEAQNLEAKLEEFRLLRTRVELLENQHVTEMEVEQARRQELILENEELVAQVLALRHANAKNRVYEPDMKSPPSPVARSSGFEQNETVAKLSESNHSLQKQLKLVEEKLSEANSEAHAAQEKSLARVAKLEKQLAQASVMCEKLLQSSMYWRDRRQAMTRARIMIPIQGGGHGRMRKENPVGKGADSTATTQRDSIDRFF